MCTVRWFYLLCQIKAPTVTGGEKNSGISRLNFVEEIFTWISRKLVMLIFPVMAAVHPETLGVVIVVVVVHFWCWLLRCKIGPEMQIRI